MKVKNIGLFSDKRLMKYSQIKIVALLFFILVIPFFFSNAEMGNMPIDQQILEPIKNSQEFFQRQEGTLLGTKTGLYQIKNNTPTLIWENGEVLKIIHTDEWIFLTSNGIFASTDLVTFEDRNKGLPFYKIKKIVDNQKQFAEQVDALKDLAIHPENPKIMVTTTKDETFLTYDAGKSWKSLGFSAKTNGAKAVAVCNMPNSAGTPILTVFLVHSIYGLGYIHPEISSPKWIDITGGFENMPSISYPDEISDLLTVQKYDETQGKVVTELYVAQTYMPCIYRLNWATKRGEILGKDTEPLSTIESIFVSGNKIVYVKPSGFGSFDLPTKTFENNPNFTQEWKALASRVENTQCMFIPENTSSFGQAISLNELWLLEPNKIYSSYIDTIDEKKALYIPAGQATPGEDLQKFLDIMSENKLNTAVIDMKDDYGLLRYVSKDDFVNQKAVSSMYAIDLDAFVKQCKQDDIYLVARIVVFKDRNLWRYGGGKYAIKDAYSGKSWQGIRRYNDVLDENGNVIGEEAEYYDEHWVDPYCEDVWAYNVAIAKELISRGFDEIQFDYIRFPTDGLNLSNVKYTWRDSGMEKEGALMSFLAYARENIDAPIGIDIYGANGWYRSGSRTGQDVEMLANYVDVICPMFYPNHFENNFLAYPPEVERPYRIYFYGSYRNSVIARNKVLIRPWLQAFYLAVSYDKKYYNEDYVLRQVYGTRDSIDNGYMYWNNSGRYDDISQDPGNGTYPWQNEEASTKYRKPALQGPNNTQN